MVMINLHVSPDKEAMRILNKIGLTELGFPYYDPGWNLLMERSMTAVLRVNNR